MKAKLQKTPLELGRFVQKALLNKVWPEYLNSKYPINIPFGPCHRCNCTHPGWGLTVIGLRSFEYLQPWELTYYIAHQLAHEISSRNSETYWTILTFAGLYSAIDINEIGKIQDHAVPGISISDIVLPVIKMTM